MDCIPEQLIPDCHSLIKLSIRGREKAPGLSSWRNETTASKPFRQSHREQAGILHPPVCMCMRVTACVHVDLR